MGLHPVMCQAPPGVGIKGTLPLAGSGPNDTAFGSLGSKHLELVHEGEDSCTAVDV